MKKLLFIYVLFLSVFAIAQTGQNVVIPYGSYLTGDKSQFYNPTLYDPNYRGQRLINFTCDSLFLNGVQITSGGSGSGTVTGTGTQNYVPKWNNAGGTEIGNSLIFDNGTSVAIGNASPTASTAFEVNSTTKAFLPTRLTAAQIGALTPIPGMLAYNSDNNSFWGYTNYLSGTSEQFVTNISNGTASNYTRWGTGTQITDALLVDSTGTWTVAKGIRLDELKIPTGAGAAKVWTSDANGLGSWATPASSSLTGATGDLISFSATDTTSNISAVSAGSYLRSNGTSTLPLWSTLKLPNSATANYIPYATSTNTWGESIDMRFDGTTFKLFNSFPSLHVRSNIASNGGVLVYQRGGESISSANQRYAMNIAAYGNGGATTTGNMCMIGFTHVDATTTLYTPSTIIGSVLETGGNFGNSGFFVATRSVTTDIRPTERFRVANNGNVSIGTGAIGTALLHIAAGTATAGTAPLKTPEGTLLTTPESGAHEFANDKAYYTIPTGTARKEFTLNDAALTSTYLPIATTNGRLTNSIMKQDGSNNIITQDGIWGFGVSPSTAGIFGSSASGGGMFFNLLSSKDVVLSTDAGLFDGTGAELTLDTSELHIYLPLGELAFGIASQFTQPFDCKITGVGKTFYQHFGSTNDMFGDITLTAGVGTVTISGLATTDRAFVQLTTPGGTLGTHYKAVCTANTLTITAVDTAGSTVTSDTSTLTYHIIRKSN